MDNIESNEPAGEKGSDRVENDGSLASAALSHFRVRCDNGMLLVRLSSATFRYLTDYFGERRSTRKPY